MDKCNRITQSLEKRRLYSGADKCTAHALLQQSCQTYSSVCDFQDMEISIKHTIRMLFTGTQIATERLTSLMF